MGGFTGQDAALPGFLRVEPSPAQKAALDDLHLRKIDLADEVLILNRGAPENLYLFFHPPSGIGFRVSVPVRARASWGLPHLVKISVRTCPASPVPC
jgi:hypothetical protein